MNLDHPIVGFRFWRIRQDSPTLLGSLIWWPVSIWYPGPNTAQCMYGSGHSTPNESCTCGYYAYHEMSVGRPDIAYPYLGNYVFGIVRGWGQVRVHPDGWRAQYAEVMALFDMPNRYPLLELAKIYQVPLLPLGDLDTLLEEFGKPVPKELRPVASPGENEHA